MNDATLIDLHGGPSRLAEKLGYPKAGGTQRVFNWMERGIPPRVKLERQDLFGPEAVRALELSTASSDATPEPRAA